MKQQLLSLLVAAGLLYAAPMVFAWSRPAQTPPAGNTPAPLNVGTSPQIKDGWLGLFGAAAGLTVSKEITYQKPTSLLVGVKGAVGADRYCDAAGTTCGTIGDLLGGSSTTTNLSYSTTTVSGATCQFVMSPFVRNISIAAGNNKGAVSDFMRTIPGGTYTVRGSGKSVKCGGDSCGNHVAYVYLSNNGSFGTGVKKLYYHVGKAGKDWSIPTQTFTTEGEEIFRAAVYQGSMTGTVYITGPKLICPLYQEEAPQQAPA